MGVAKKIFIILGTIVGTFLFFVWTHHKSVGTNYIRSAQAAVENIINPISGCPAQNPCRNSGTCVGGRDGAFSCQCSRGFGGKHCEINIDDCDPNPCKNNGKCFDELNNFSCACLPGYEGRLCEQDIDDCAVADGRNKCRNEGACIDGVDSFSCQCKTGFAGKFCEQRLGEGGDGVTYKGCYIDSREERDLTENFQMSNSMSNKACWEHCAGYKYAGTQYSMECWCGNSVGKHGQAAEEDCYMQCNGDRKSKCGGDFRNTVYYIGD